MSERLKEEMLETFRNRVDNATPLPWKVFKNEYMGTFGWVSEDVVSGITSEVYEYADAEFIAHVREDVPALLDEIDLLRKENHMYELAVAEDDATKERLLDEIERLQLKLERLELSVLNHCHDTTEPYEIVTGAKD